MKKIVIVSIMILTFFSFFKINVEAKEFNNYDNMSIYSFAPGSGSGSGNGGGGGASCDGLFTADALDMIETILDYFRILAPVALIVLVAVDFSTAVISQDNDALNKAQSKVVARTVGAVLTFFVPTIVKIILNLPGIREAIEIPSDPLCGTMNSYPIELVQKWGD